MTLSPPARVLVVDDFEPWRRFVCSTLEVLPGYQVVGQASDGLAAVQRAQALQPDLILLDIGLPDLNGIEAARQISLISPASKILFVSENCDSDVVKSALRDGAMGYVRKSDGDRELLSGMTAALQGKWFVSRGLADVIDLRSSPD